MSFSQAIPWPVPALAGARRLRAPDAVAPHAGVEVVHGAVKVAEGVLARRGQRAEVVQDRGWTASYLSRGKLGAMLAHAVCEVSALSQGSSAIRVRVSAQGIAISGRNPIVLPDDRLQVDDILRQRCRGLGVPVSLFWEQGSGPCLVLYLPQAQ
jgi:hypothetical protein